VPSPDHHCPVESCLTLSSFAANVSFYLDNNTSLIFQPGNHTVQSKLNITNVAEFSMTSASHSAKQSSLHNVIICELSLSFFIFEAVDHIYIADLNFFGCENTFFLKTDPTESMLIKATVSSLILLGCTFENIQGRVSVIFANYSNITVAQTTFSNSTAISSILSYDFCNSKFVNTTFISNRGVLVNDSSVATSSNTLIFTGCEFRNNYRDLGAIIIVQNSDISIINTKFTKNRAIAFLPSLCISNSVVSIDRSVFKHNYGSAIAFSECTVYIFDSVYDSNQGRETGYGGAITSYDSVIHIYSSEFKKNVAPFTGGAIFCKASSITFYEICTLTDNRAREGGAVHLHQRAQYHVAHGATVIIANNTASADGGGIYLDLQCGLTLHGQSALHLLENSALELGGGIYASGLSSINAASKLNTVTNSVTHIHKNRARRGGGMYLEINSIVYTNMCHNNSISFQENSAEYGGAVYIVSTIEDPVPADCFFQPLPHSASTCNITGPGTWSKQNDRAFTFSLNRADNSGASLFKEEFTKCSRNKKLFEELLVISSLSNIQISDIGSFQVQVCYCKNNTPDCTIQIPFIDIKTGEKIMLDVAIVNVVSLRQPIYGSIESEIRGHILIRDDQKFQNVMNGCTPIIFDIYSLTYSQQLIISPWFEDDSIVEGSKRTIKLNFLACIECPIGFQKTNDDARGCDCACNYRVLETYIINCNYTRETITKRGTTAWITHLTIQNTSGYLIYPQCPMDYCHPPDSMIEINLNIPNGADAQCAHNHSGLLCGACSPGLSLSLGSSRCLKCHIYWPGVLIAIIISSLLAGIILVASLLMLNLTVAVGTLNGLIFYVNIVAVNQHKFFPSTNFITVAISWLNLELGIDTCFFDGMDFYWKTWIQLAFPTYILLLVVLVIVISEHSVKFAKMVAKRNPLATLNTLILLSYVKFLRTIILAFSFSTLDYPDGSHPVVWWPDATVGYFSGKHVILWIAAALILVAGIFYTAILFSWQWLLYYQHKRIFKWIIQNQRLCMFVEPNHAPYVFKHRYWAGLLLLVRVIVYIISTADVSSNRATTLLAIGIVVFLLTILLCSFRPYKSRLVQALEVICYANIVCLCFATSYVLMAGKSQDTIAYISGTVSLILFLIVLMYHIITQVFFTTPLGKWFKNKPFHGIKTEQQVSLVVQGKKNDEPVTYSEVAPPAREEDESLSDSDNLTSLSKTNTLSESFSCEENELRPIEHEVTDSSTPYFLMK
jgi:predicted outer membrane repeat protein